MSKVPQPVTKFALIVNKGNSYLNMIFWFIKLNFEHSKLGPQKKERLVVVRSEVRFS